MLRRTNRKRMRRKLNEIKLELRRRLHVPVPAVGKWLGAVLRGHFDYYGVPHNTRLTPVPLSRRLALASRSAAAQPEDRLTWERMRGLRALATPPTSCTRIPTCVRPQDPRQEPSAVVPHAGICAGGAGQPASLPRWVNCRRGSGPSCGIGGWQEAHDAQGTAMTRTSRCPSSKMARRAPSQILLTRRQPLVPRAR